MQHCSTDHVDINDINMQHRTDHVDINENSQQAGLTPGLKYTAEKLEKEKIISVQSEKTELLTDTPGAKSARPATAPSQTPCLSSWQQLSPHKTETASASSSAPSSLPVIVSTPTTSHPTHFNRGSIIQLADGCMKPVEELVTEDFIQSASRDKHVAIDMSTFVKVEPQPDTDSDRDVNLTFSVGKEKLRVRVTAPSSHPFFVYGARWSSVSPRATLARYRLESDLLSPGDVCISLTHQQLARP